MQWYTAGHCAWASDMAAVTNVRTLQQWRKTTGGAALVLGDVAIISAHICDKDGVRLLLATIAINDAEYLFGLRGDYRDDPKMLCGAIIHFGELEREHISSWMKAPWVSQWRHAYCPCGSVRSDLLLLCAGWGFEVTFSMPEPHGSSFTPPRAACNAIARLMKEVGGRHDICMKISTMLIHSFFSLTTKSFDLSMPVPADIQPYVEWAADKPIRSVTIWDYWYSVFRPHIQAGALTAEDIRRDIRVDGKLAKANLSNYLAARGHHFDDVVKAWTAGMEYSFESRKGVLKAPAEEMTPPSARPHGWQPAKSVGRKSRLSKD